MKLAFFLIAFSLVSIRVYYSWAGLDRNRRGESTANIVIESDHLYEEIKYSGKIELNDSETAFKSMSPGSYFKFRLNDLRIKAESNLKGEIEYSVWNKDNIIQSPEEIRAFTATAIQQTLWWGFDAEARMERLYKKGGTALLLKEADSIRPGNLKIRYYEKVLNYDTGLNTDLPRILIAIGRTDDNMSKSIMLKKITPSQLNDSLVANAWFDVLKSIPSDVDKAGALNFLIDQDSVAQTLVLQILNAVSLIEPDIDRVHIYDKLLDKHLIGTLHFDYLLDRIATIGSDVDKQNLYRRLTDEKDLRPDQWVLLLMQISRLGSDVDKTSLLVETAQKMPLDAQTKPAYLSAAKTIHNDMDYGRAMRAIN